MGDCRIDCGDVLEVMRGYPDGSFSRILTDPPYELGYMNKAWDASGIAFSVELWREALRVLEPGGYLMAFGAPRTYHRLTVAVEDAGFEIRDCLMWLYTSGFPKQKSCLKPAWEPILLARKPAKKVQALNIDESRIGDEVRWNKTANNVDESGWGLRPQYEGEKQQGSFVKGRWPSNVLFDEGVCPEEYESYFFCSKANKEERNRGLSEPNPHPTVKPIALAQWLSKLLMKPEPGSILIPFSGVGSEMIAAKLAGWDTVIGIEREQPYVEVAHARLKEWIV